MSKTEIVRIVVAITTWVLSAGLDITAGILGIKAEDAQSHAKHVRIIFFECKKRSYSAYVLGMYAAGFLVGGHILTNLLGMCSAPSNFKSSIRKTLGLLFLLFAWLTFIPSVGMMVLAAKSNDSSKVECGISHHNYLYYGALLCFLHAIWSLGYFANYILLSIFDA